MTNSVLPLRTLVWIRHVGRLLALVAQLVLVVVPLAESHADRALGAHVEAPRTTAHPGHRPDSCPACVLLTVHGQPLQRAEIPALNVVDKVAAPEAALYTVCSVQTPSNSCRAPPFVV